MAWVDATYLNNLIEPAQVTALGLTGAVLTQYEAAARATVQSVLQYAGYPTLGATLDPAAVSTPMLQQICAAVLVRDAYAMRKGIQLPQPTREAINDALGKLDAIHQRALPVPGLAQSTSAGYGGVLSSGATRPPTMGRRETSGW